MGTSRKHCNKSKPELKTEVLSIIELVISVFFLYYSLLLDEYDALLVPASFVKAGKFMLRQQEQTALFSKLHYIWVNVAANII